VSSLSLNLDVLQSVFMKSDFDPATMGEEFRAELTFGWIVVGGEIAGTPIVPIIIPATDETNQLGTLHLGRQDLVFTLF